MSKIKYTDAKLARDVAGSILQVGSYRTDEYQNLDASSSTVFAINATIRIQSYGADNWIRRVTPEVDAIDSFTLAISNGHDKELDFTGIYNYTGPGIYQLFTDSNVTATLTGNLWKIVDSTAPTFFYTMTGNGVNIPTEGTWKITHAEAIDYTNNPVATYGDSGALPTYALPTSATLNEGLLLPIGAEITMLVLKSDIISSTSTVNIVEVKA